MNTAETILVIFLSSALALFLVLGIVLLVKVIRLVDSVKRITDKAEELADKAGAVSELFGRLTNRYAAGRLVKTVIDLVRNHSTSKKKETDHG